MRSNHKLFLLAILLATIALAPAAPLPAAKILSLPVAEWTAKSEAADQALRAGRWEDGRAAAEGLIGEILSRPAEGPGLGELLARSVVYRAVALAGTGKTEAAEWAAASARELGFSAKDLDLSAYGKAGELVRAALDPLALDVEKLEVGKGISRPQFLERSSPAYPPTLRKSGVGGTVIVETVIGRDGKTSRPLLLHSPSIFLSLAALDSLQTWRFAPAQRDGKPITVSYVLTVNFQVDPSKE